MYESFFGLHRRPFAASPDTVCFVSVEPAAAALEELAHCVESGQGVGVLTAAAGLGKTIVCRKLAELLQNEYAVAFLPGANFPTRRSLLQAILFELGREYSRLGEQELRLLLTTAMRDLRAELKAMLLIIDEAHLLSPRLLEEVRTVMNLVEDGRPLARIVLSGQLPLEEKLAEPSADALNQRICRHANLPPLTRLESAEYILHRLKCAGADLSDVFTRDAVQVICSAADGVPRCINFLSDHSLLLSYLEDVRPVDAEIVRAALEDVRQLPLHWNEPTPAAEPLEQMRDQLEAARATKREIASITVDEVTFETTHNDEACKSPASDEPVFDEAVFETGDAEIDCAADLPAEPSEETVFEVGAGCEASSDAPPPVVKSPYFDSQVEWEPVAVELDAASTNDDAPVEDVDFHSQVVFDFIPAAAVEDARDHRSETSPFGPSEEPVHDRYALLDASAPVDGFNHETPATVESESESESESDEDCTIETLDAADSLLDVAINSIDEGDDALPTTIELEGAETEVDATVEVGDEEVGNEIEQSISRLVMETCAEAREVLDERVRETAAEIETPPEIVFGGGDRGVNAAAPVDSSQRVLSEPEEWVVVDDVPPPPQLQSGRRDGGANCDQATRMP